MSDALLSLFLSSPDPTTVFVSACLLTPLLIEHGCAAAETEPVRYNVSEMTAWDRYKLTNRFDLGPALRPLFVGAEVCEGARAAAIGMPGENSCIVDAADTSTEADGAPGSCVSAGINMLEVRSLRFYGYLTNLTLWLFVGLTVAISRIRQTLSQHWAAPQLAGVDDCIARWYLLNGTLIHMLMDGCVGSLGMVPLLAESYAHLDRRFTLPFGHEAGSTVWLVGALELTVKGPLCVLLYFGYHSSAAWRDPLELLVCALQFYGTLMFAGTEVVHGLPNVWRGWAVSLDAGLFFWFGFVACEAIWIVVPLVLGARAWRRIVRGLSARGAAPSALAAPGPAPAAPAPPARAAPSARPKLRLPRPTRGHAELFKRA